MSDRLSTHRYAHIHPDVIERVVRDESPKYRKESDRRRAVRNRLHIMFGAYADDKLLNRLLREFTPDISVEVFDTLRMQALRSHLSTRERAEAVRPMYDFILKNVDPPATIADLGCGLNPFELPEWQPPTLLRYDAYDIDLRVVELTNRLLKRMGLPQSAYPLDLAVRTPGHPVDVALALKLIPVLDAQRPGRGIELLIEMPARIVVASYPLGGMSDSISRDKLRSAKERNYSAQLEAGVSGVFEIVAKDIIGDELVYILYATSRLSDRAKPSAEDFGDRG